MKNARTKILLLASATVLTVSGVAIGQTPPAPGASAPAPARPARLPTQAQWDAAPGVQLYVDRAMQIAGDDEDLKFDAGVFCKPTGGASTPERRAFGVPNSEPRLEPFPTPEVKRAMPAARLADNWYRIGDSGVGMFLFTTPEGYILFDAGNNESDITDILEPEMARLGLDPNLIEYVVIGHYHLDHTGGLKVLQDKYDPQIIMGRDDWPRYEADVIADEGGRNRLQNHTPANRDIAATDGMQITVGDTTATIHQMTGHTPGSLGMIIPVKYQGTSHPVLLVTAGSDFPNRESFIGGYEHIWDAGIRAGVESVVQVHPNTNMNSLAREKYVTENYPVARNPILYGAERTERYINIVRACSQARMEALNW